MPSKLSARVLSLRVGVVGVVAAAMLAGPSAYSAYTIAHANTGSVVAAGPKSDSGMGGPGDGGPGGTAPNAGGTPPNGGNGQGMPGGPNDSGTASDNSSNGMPGGSSDGKGGSSASAGKQRGASSPGGPGQMTVSDTLKSKLKEDSDKYKWSAATIGSQGAASYQLATDTDVMPIGGFSGSDDAPTLDQFKKLVSEKKIYFFIADSGQGGAPGGNNEITSWVKEHFTATTIDGVTVYDLTQEKSS